MALLLSTSFSLCAQKVTLNCRQQKLETVLTAISKQTNLSLAYSPQYVDLDKNVTISVADTDLQEVLKRLLAGTGIGFRIEEHSIFLFKQETQKDDVSLEVKTRKISGKVVDANGEPVIGANVVIKDKHQGTTTDINGRFTLSVTGNEKLTVSYIGYTTIDVSTTGKDYIDVKLEEDARNLKEVVVIGYGNTTKKDITSSITSLKAADMNKGSFVNPIELLQGKVPGLTVSKTGDPNKTPSIVMRGLSTLRTGAAQEPLYVVDGVPGTSIVAPEDIESIDVLRDASASSIYGSRAANGVILITTKRGRKGRMEATYSGYVTLDQVASRMEMMDADEYRSWLSANGKELLPENDMNVNTDWQRVVQNKYGLTHSHNVSLSGGTEQTLFSSNINMKDVQGLMKKSNLNALTLRANLEHKVLDNRLTLGMAFSGDISESESPISDYIYLYSMRYQPTVAPYNADGSYYEDLNRVGYLNPLALINENDADSKLKRMLMTAKANLKLMEELDLNLNYSLQNSQLNSNSYKGKKSQLAKGLDGEAIRSSYENQNKILEITANFSRKIKGMHDVKALLGYSWQEDHNNNGFQTSNIGFPSDATGYHNLGLGIAPKGYVPQWGPGDSKLRMISFFGRINYSYADKYLLQASLRDDGSSAFGKNNRWGLFPSVSAAWRMSQERFMQHLTSLDDLKIRVGYGVSGNSLGFDPLASQMRYGTVGTFYNNGEIKPAIGPVSNANPDLKWEKTAMLNIGVDFGFFNNRLTGTVEYYDKKTSDLIYTYTVPTTEYLYGSMIANVGSIDNRGFEIQLSGIPVWTRNFKWRTSLVISHNENEVVSLSNDKFKKDYEWVEGIEYAQNQSGQYNQIIKEGCPLGQYNLWIWMGRNEDGISQFLKGDGKGNPVYDENGNPVLTTSPTMEDHFIVGDPEPKVAYGWTNSFEYKNWDASFFFRGTAGNDILNGSRAYLTYMGAQATLYNQPKSVAQTEDIRDINANFISDRYLEDGSYLRLDNVTLGYTFQNIGKLIQKFRVYASVNNVFILTKYKGIDPEISLSGSQIGVEDGVYYPKTRTFMLGASINF